MKIFLTRKPGDLHQVRTVYIHHWWVDARAGCGREEGGHWAGSDQDGPAERAQGRGGEVAEDFHEKYFQLQDVAANYWKLTLSLVRTDHADFVLDLKSGRQRSTNVLVCTEGRGLHCVDVRDKESLGGVYHCINSHGSSSLSCAPVCQPGNILYRVQCAAQPMGTHSLDCNLEKLLHKLGLLHLRDQFERNGGLRS